MGYLHTVCMLSVLQGRVVFDFIMLIVLLLAYRIIAFVVLVLRSRRS